MAAVLGGLAAACCWALTGLFAQHAGRVLGSVSTFAWSALCGLVLVAIPVVVVALSAHIATDTALELLGAGMLNVIGLVAQFSALSRGRVSLIVPITSAEGAVAAAISAADGAHIGVIGWVALLAVGVGVAVNAITGRPVEDSGAGAKRGAIHRDVALAIAAALLFGCGLFMQGRAGSHVPVGLAIAPPAVMGTVLVTVPMAASRRLHRPRGAFLAVLGIGVAELLGFLSYVVAARRSVPVAAVVASQYATISVVLGIAFLHERPRRIQYLGYLLIVGGVVVISSRQ